MNLSSHPVRLLIGAALIFGSVIVEEAAAQVEPPATLGRLGQTTKRVVNRREVEESKFSLLPVPVIEPTLKEGGMLIALWEEKGHDGLFAGYDAQSGLATMYTTSDSWLVGAFHNGSYFDELFDLGLVAARGRFNYEFNGFGENPLLRFLGVDLQADYFIFTPKITTDLPWEDWSVSFDYLFLEADASVGLSPLGFALFRVPVTSKTAGVGFTVDWKTFDNEWDPDEGWHLQMGAGTYDPAFGGDFQYQRYGGKFVHFIPLDDQFIFGYRGELTSVQGNAPFYDLPSIPLRGFPAPRYKANAMAAFEGQLECKLNEKLSWSVFGGVGKIANDVGRLDQAPRVGAWGSGFRFKPSKDKPLTVGFDVARGDGEWSLYFQVGNGLAY